MDFPKIGTSAEFHRVQLQDYTSTVIYRDIVDRNKVSGGHVLKHLLVHCLRNSATIFSITNMYQTMKSMGYELSKDALYKYMRYFEDAYCIFSVEKYELSQRKASTSMKKVFAVDQGLITSVTLASGFDLAAQLETAVFAHLRRQTDMIYYYRTLAGYEVDFLIILPDQSKKLYQVCLSLDNAGTRSRELRALSEAMSELGHQKGTIISFDEEEEIELLAGKISIIPIWKLLLGV